VKNTSLEKAR